MQHYSGSLNKHLLRVSAHVLFWVLYVLFYTVQYILFSDSPGFLSVAGRLSLSVWIDIAATYFTVYLLIPGFLLKKRYVAFALLLLASAAVMVLAQRVLLYYVSYPMFSPRYLEQSAFWSFNPFYSFINIYTVVSVFAGFKLLRFWYRTQQQKEELEQQNRMSELALLKAQVSPHFLFNTLNNIDSLIARDAPSASEAVIRLSEILRYMLYEAETDRVLLEREVFYLQSYIALQEMRISTADFVRFEITGDVAKQTIAPMLLIPFVENAFKHGLKSTEAPGIRIALGVKPEMITFKVVNKINKWEQAPRDQTSGIGLKNIRKRLDLIYPGAYDLRIGRDNSDFSAELTIRKP
jgi:sensor histidine kinase YesM